MFFLVKNVKVADIFINIIFIMYYYLQIKNCTYKPSTSISGHVTIYLYGCCCPIGCNIVHIVFCKALPLPINTIHHFLNSWVTCS